MEQNAVEQQELFNSAIRSYNIVIEHYDFVINDISSEIYDPKLEAVKIPVISFLKEMKTSWEKCRDDVCRQRDHLKKE